MKKKREGKERDVMKAEWVVEGNKMEKGDVLQQREGWREKEGEGEEIKNKRLIDGGMV